MNIRAVPFIQSCRYERTKSFFIGLRFFMNNYKKPFYNTKMKSFVII